MDELKPCPFCGGDNQVLFMAFFTEDWAVGCNDCSCQGPTTVESKEEAIEKWNDRKGTINDEGK